MSTLNNSQSDINNFNVERVDNILGKGLQMPFSPSNSGSRKLMFGIQLEHRLPILNPDVPFIQTGYENEFGKNSSSYITSKQTCEVIGTVYKFSNLPKHHYYIFTVDRETNILSVFERKSYNHITENYGYLFNNKYLDSLNEGSIIEKGTVVQKSMAFDEWDNRMDGKNLLTMYTACEETIEDAIVISESAAQKLASPLIKKVSIVINDNDIPLNLYGDVSKYKICPDIGEDTRNTILCGLRREKKEEALFSQSYSRLRELAISDEKYLVEGKVVDINVYCNSPEKLSEYDFNSQLKFYHDEKIRMNTEIVNLLNIYLEEGYTMDFDLQRLYYNSLDCINGKRYFSERAFSNIILEIFLVEEIPVLPGDKLSNRYGGKGITAVIKPNEMMPVTQSGQTVDVLLNMCGVYGRENAGQLFELTISYICIKIVQYMKIGVLTASDCIDLYIELLHIVSPSMAEYIEQLVSRMTDIEQQNFVYDIYCGDNSIYLAIEPMSENMTIDKVKDLYTTFPWIRPEQVLMPVLDSNNKIKYVGSRRPLVYGYQYIYRLKQYAEEKFSVTSLSSTNIRNENSKSKNSNNYKALYSRTPIRFGDMETGNLIHLGAELVVQMLMLYSASPNARRLTEEMLTGDAFNIDVKLDGESKNRNVEILNVYLKTMGLKLTFKKRIKKMESGMLIDPMYFYDKPNRLIEGLIQLNKNERIDMEQEVARLLKENKHGIEIYPMEFTRMDGEEIHQ